MKKSILLGALLLVIGAIPIAWGEWTLCEHAIHVSRDGRTVCRLAPLKDTEDGAFEMLVESIDCVSGQKTLSFRRRCPKLSMVIAVANGPAVAIRAVTIGSVDEPGAVSIMRPDTTSDVSLSLRALCAQNADRYLTSPGMQNAGTVLIEHAYFWGDELRLIFDDRLTVTVDVRDGKVLRRLER